MKQIIYIDILIFVNLIINYFLLLATAKFLYLKLKPFRLLAGEILSAVYSLFIFVPNISATASFFIKLIMASTIVLTVFKFKTPKTFLKILACFFSVNFAFSGLMMAMWCLAKPHGMAVGNGIVYFNISPTVLIFSSLISYMVIEFINKTVGKKETKNHLCDICISVGNKFANLKAKVDTGNSLQEPFSHLPVVIVNRDVVSGILPKEFSLNFLENIQKNSFCESKNLACKIRMVPFKTVSGEGLFPAFKPDGISVRGGPKKEVYIALCPEKTLSSETPALISPELLD